MKEEGTLISADSLVPCLVLVVARAALERSVSTQAFIEEFLDPAKRTDELFCMFVNFQCAAAYLRQLEPRCALVRVALAEETLPLELWGRIAPEEYNKLLGSLRALVAGTPFGLLRAEGAGVGGSIGAATGALVAAGAVLSLGAALPLSLGVVAAGTAIGTAAGGALPWRRKEVFRELETLVQHINAILEPRSIVLVDPVVTNKLGASSGIAAVKDIEWVIKSLDS